MGPRPERPEFVRELVEEIPFYNVRHVVKPGMAGEKSAIRNAVLNLSKGPKSKIENVSRCGWTPSLNTGVFNTWGTSPLSSILTTDDTDFH